MARAPKTDPHLPHPKATCLTMAICGFATLALATVLGVSLASSAANGEDAPVTIVTRPPATDMALIAGEAPFDVAGCTVTAAARP